MHRFPALLLLLLAACSPPDTGQPADTGAAPGTGAAPDTTIGNLRAFAKLYGYVRWFHPSDAAAGLDWDAFAVYGCERVATAANSEELARILKLPAAGGR